MTKENKLSSINSKIRSTKELGDFLQAYRKSHKLTQADISGLANTGNRFIGELENGKDTVQFKKVLDVISVLGLELIITKKGGF
jgi:y4mF family transcriptional regulator